LNYSFEQALNAYTQGAVFTAFDLETTGLDPKLDRIAEFGAIKFDNRGIMARYSTLINPEIPMPEEAGRVNGITDAMLSGMPLIEEALPRFLNFVRNTIILAHNAPFDCGFVNESLNRLASGGKVYSTEPHSGEGSPLDAAVTTALANPIADSLVLAREAFPGRKSYSLQNLAADLAIPKRNAHRAEDDALLCMELFIRCLGVRNEK
jgi:DNA polymerase-3 subunit epsilon